jgi:GT2 family glycosyltransferase
VGPALSVIIATRNRAALLAPMLRSLDAALASSACPAEVIVVDNGSTDGTAAVIEHWAAGATGRGHLTVRQPGKARALNAGVAAARADLLAFTDDDVEVAPAWIGEIVGFFAAHPEYAAATGRVRIPPRVTDRAVLAQVAYYRTLPLFDRGDGLQDSTHLYGCNMAVRRAGFDRVGVFDERLGPGASGLHEDGDLARRLRHAGLRIAYVPGMLVYHTVEPSRLTVEYFRTLHRADARSRYVMQPDRSWLRSVADWLGAALVLGWWSLLGNAARRMRARGRLISHGELLRLRYAARYSSDSRRGESRGGDSR